MFSIACLFAHCGADNAAACSPERFAEWSYSKHAAFYPSVFDLRDTTLMKNPRGALDNTTVPAIMQHFVAYVQGAAGIVPP
jgi:hypothetical protein